MLTEGKGEHVQWSSEGGGENHVWGGSNPEGGGGGGGGGGGYMDGTGGVTPPGRSRAYS